MYDIEFRRAEAKNLGCWTAVTFILDPKAILCGRRILAESYGSVRTGSRFHMLNSIFSFHF